MFLKILQNSQENTHVGIPLTSVLIHSSTIWLEGGVKDSCSENFVILAEKYLWEFFFLNEALRRQIWFLRNLRNIQCDWQYKSRLLNVIKEEIINFEYFYFDIRDYSFFFDLKLLKARILDIKLAVYVLSYSSSLPC